MKTLHRNKRKITICKLLGPNEKQVRTYDKPIVLLENWQVINASSEFKSVGQEVYDSVRIKTSADHAKYYHFGDRAYIDIEAPEEYDMYCETADYEVVADPIVTLNECNVLLKKLSGRNGRNVY